MADLTTNYLGLALTNPLVVSASSLSDMPSQARQLEDAGAGAIVLRSLFEEQITRYKFGQDYLSRSPAAETAVSEPSPFPRIDTYPLSPDGYTSYIRQLKQILNIPVIASLNGYTTDIWIRYARLIEQAGADALELNMYVVASDANVTGAEIEAGYVDLVRQIRTRINIPIAVKLSPYFSATANMAQRLVAAGADALVLFNRFYQPDIDLETLSVVPNLQLSTSAELRLRLRWVAILSGQLTADFAITGGVHSREDVVKSLLAGAQVTMMASACSVPNGSLARRVA